jgi:hypothetical protein
MARAGGGNHYYGDTAEDLMEPFQQELDLLANLALRQVELSVSAPDGLRVEMLNELPTVGAGWRLPDLAWGAEAWAILRVTAPAGAVPGLGDRMTVLRVSVTGQSLQGARCASLVVGAIGVDTGACATAVSVKPAAAQPSRQRVVHEFTYGQLPGGLTKFSISPSRFIASIAFSEL